MTAHEKLVIGVFSAGAALNVFGGLVLMRDIGTIGTATSSATCLCLVFIQGSPFARSRFGIDGTVFARRSQRTSAWLRPDHRRMATPRALHGGDYAERFDRMHVVDGSTAAIALMQLDEGPTTWSDFACGNGLLAAEVHDRVHSYTGVDFSQPFVDLAHARAARLGARNLGFKCTSIAEFCATHPRRFDVACAFDFSEHVPDDEWRVVLADMRRSLKTGGRLYLHTPNAGFILERLKRRNLILRQSPEHVACVTWPAILNSCANRGSRSPLRTSCATTTCCATCIRSGTRP